MLKLEGIAHAFSNAPVLQDINLEVESGEIFCLLGPSGCGKTTLLRTVAGLIVPDDGNIWFDGQALRALPVHERDFGFMFQDFALFPHLNVADNVGFGLKMRGDKTKNSRVRDVLRIVDLQDFAHRDLVGLSGGEKQRVALARSLAPQPRLLMLDEPLGSLDAALRNQLAIDLRRIIKSVGLTALYVTHDQQEAFALADRLAVMNAGRLEQIDTPEAIYQRPVTEFVARFLGLNNIAPVLHYAEGQTITALGDFPGLHPATKILLHPMGLRLVDSHISMPTFSGRVVQRIFMGDVYRLSVLHESGVRLDFKVPAVTPDLPAIDALVQVSIDPAMIVPLA